jgi:hypothetical protein
MEEDEKGLNSGQGSVWRAKILGWIGISDLEKDQYTSVYKFDKDNVRNKNVR